MSSGFDAYTIANESFFDLNLPPKESLDEGVIQHYIYNDSNQTEEKTKQEEECNMRMTCTQEWFIRCSWINKFTFLEMLCKSTSGLMVLEDVLKSIESIFSKDVLESLSHRSTNFDYDKIPTDDNRALEEDDLAKAMKDSFLWFVNLNYNYQARVILRLLRLGGGGLVFQIYKTAAKIFADRKLPSECMIALRRGEESELAPEGSYEMDRRDTNRTSISVESDSLKDYYAKKQIQLHRRAEEFRKYKLLRGLVKDESRTTLKNGGEIVDYLQILPMALNRKIMSYLDDKTLSGLKKVGKYWSKMIDESINEKSGRKAINAKINKIIGIKAEREERKEEEEQEEENAAEEEVEVIKELGAKDLINAKNENEKALLAESGHYKSIFSRKCTITHLDTSFHPERCGVCDRSSGILACSAPSNLVHFYSLKTDARFNFLIFGLESVVTCLTLHENKTHIFIGCLDGSLIAKDFRTNLTTKSFSGHSKPVLSIQTTSSNFLSASQDNTVKYFQLWSGLCLLCIDLNPGLNITSAILRKDRSHLTAVGTEEGVVVVMNVQTKALLAKAKLHKDGVQHLAYDGDFLITGSGRGRIRVWNMNRLGSGSPTLQPYYDINVESPVRALNFYKNQIFVGCENGNLKIISLATGKISKSLKISAQTPVTGVDVMENKPFMKLVIWNEMGIEIRAFPLKKPPSKKKTGQEDKCKSEEKESRRQEIPEEEYIWGAVLPLRKTATYTGTKRPLSDRFCTIHGLRTQRSKTSQIKTDIFSEAYNNSPSRSDSFVLCTFPRNLNTNE